MSMTHRSEVVSVVKEVLQMLETQTGNQLPSVRIDRGTEYLSAQLEAFFKEKGVRHETTAPYTPEQNEALQPNTYEESQGCAAFPHLLLTLHKKPK